MNYVSIVSTSGKWLYCNNVELSVVHWPKGAKDMHILFLERTTIDSTTGKTSSKRDINLDNAPFNPVKHKLFNENKFQNSPPGKKYVLLPQRIVS